MAKILYVGAAAVTDYNAAVERKYTKVSRYGDPIYLSKKMAGSKLYLPRGLFEVSPECGENYDRRISGRKIDVNGNFKPRNKEQARVVKEATALLKEDKSFLLQAPTGFGKTAVTVEIIRQVAVTTLVIVTKEDVKTQWIEAFQKFLGLDRSQVGIIQGDKFNVAGKPVAIAMIQSVCKKGRYPAWVYKAFGMVVVDEVHRMGADKFSEASWLFPAKLRLGLSATPQRKDGKDIVFRSHIGPVRVVTEAIPMVPTVLRVKMRNPHLSKVYHKPGRTMGLNKALASDTLRNKYIAGFIATAYEKDRNIVFFSDLTIHLENMHDYLLTYGVKEKDIGFYVGGLSEDERDVAKAKSVVLATYMMCSEATDAPWWDTAVLGTPRSDVQQIVGRILREYPDKKQPVVLDIVDISVKVFIGYAAGRNKWYNKIGAAIRMLN